MARNNKKRADRSRAASGTNNQTGRTQGATKRPWSRWLLILIPLLAVLLVGGHFLFLKAPAPAPTPDSEPEVLQYRTYQEIPEEYWPDDESFMELIRKEYYSFDGFQIHASERDIDLEQLLIPEREWSAKELSILFQTIETIGMLDGAESPIFVALKDWAEQKEGRLINELLPLDKKMAVKNGNYMYAIDAFWYPEGGFLYIGRHQLPYFMLMCSTLYQEGFHAVQLRDRKLTLEDRAAIELEAHEAQIRFNEKLLALAMRAEGAKSRRWVLELRVINQNLRESQDAYRRNLIPNQGMRNKG